MNSELLQEAKRFLLIGDISYAKEVYQDILKDDPSNPEALHGLGFIAFRERDFAEAERILQKAIALNRKDPELYHSLGICYFEQKNWEKSVISLKCAKQLFESNRKFTLDQRYLNTLSRLASIYILQQSFTEAKNILRKLLRKSPNNIEALKMYAQVCVGTRAFAQALSAIKKMEIDQAIKTGLLVEIYLLKEDFSNALKCAEECLELNPAEPRFYFLKGECLIKNQRWEESVSVFEEGLELDPLNSDILIRLLTLKIRICDWKGREEIVAKLRESGAVSVPPTIGILGGFDNGELKRFSELASEKIEFAAQPVRERLRFAYGSQRGDRIRIGYLSSDFHDHATAHLMFNLFALHDRTQFEVFAYSYGKNDRSLYRKKIQKDCDHFTDIKKVSDTAAAEKIHQDRIDILIDLKGHIIDHRLGIMALKPAPVQAHYLGYPGTIGAKFIDYLIADRYVIPEAEREFYSESLVLMPDTYQVNAEKKRVARTVPTRNEYGIPTDSFVFCCFNQNDKFDPETVRAWMEILHRTPHSVLWIWGNYSKIKENLIALGKEYHVSNERFIVTPTEPSPRHLAKMHLANLFLDTFLYNAHTSCSDAIRMGLPVLTCPGKTFASRVAAGLLKTIKAESCIAKNPQEYIEMAVAHYKNPQELLRIKKQIETNSKQSALFKPHIFAENFDRALQMMWQRHQKNQKPSDIFL